MKADTYEGLQNNIKELQTPAIETWENQYEEREYTISLDVPECTCICPKTGLPDFMCVKVTYSPAKRCLELKSFTETCLNPRRNPPTR